MTKETIYTDSEVTINGVTYRNLPAQVRRNQTLSEDAAKTANDAASGIDAANAAAAAAQAAATAAQATATAAQATATAAQATATAAQTAASAAQTTATAAQTAADEATTQAEEALGNSQVAVRFDEPQLLNDSQKQQARDNIGVTEQGVTVDAELSLTSENPVQNKVITEDINRVEDIADQAKTQAQQALTEGGSAVKYTSQTLNSTQQKQARDNILAKLNSNGTALVSNITVLNTPQVKSLDTTMYKNLYIECMPKRDTAGNESAMLTMNIPILTLGSTAKRFQVADEANYVVVSISLSGTTPLQSVSISLVDRNQTTGRVNLVIATP